MNDTDVLTARLRRDFPTVEPFVDGVRTRNPATKVLDCVLSLYSRGAPRAETRRNGLAAPLEDCRSILELRERLLRLDPFPREALRYRDARRVEILRRVVDFLAGVVAARPNVTEAVALRRWARRAQPPHHRGLGIRGFGVAAFQSLRMLLGADTARPDAPVCRYVEAAVGHRVSEVETVRLLEAAGAALGVPVRDLDRAIRDRWTESAAGSPVRGGPVAAPRRHARAGSSRRSRRPRELPEVPDHPEV